MTEEIDVDAYFDQYEDLAVEIVDDASPNMQVNLSLSNRELAEAVCKTMGWESFDLFDRIDYEVIYNEEPVHVLRAYAFMSFLRWRLFTSAFERGIGLAKFNEEAAVYSEYWYIRLSDKLHALQSGQRVSHKWMM